MCDNEGLSWQSKFNSDSSALNCLQIFQAHERPIPNIHQPSILCSNDHHHFKRDYFFSNNSTRFLQEAFVMSCGLPVCSIEKLKVLHLARLKSGKGKKPVTSALLISVWTKLSSLESFFDRFWQRTLQHPLQGCCLLSMLSFIHPHWLHSKHCRDHIWKFVR